MQPHHRVVRAIITLCLAACIGAVIAGCDSNAETEAETFTVDFSEEPATWSALFSNFYPERAEDFNLISGYRPLPEPLDTSEPAFYLSGRNISDDLNMFLMHAIDGLAPETAYEASFEVAFATDAPSGCLGVGGAPGEAVTIHAVVLPEEPERVVDDSGRSPYYRLEAVVEYDGANWYRDTELGNVANSRDCEEGQAYEIKRLDSSPGHWQATTDETGRLWIMVGTRSGFEATTSLYYTRVRVTLRPV